MLVTVTPGKVGLLQDLPKVEPPKAPEADPTISLLSRAPGLAGFVEEEFTFFKACMAKLHQRAMKWRRNFHGQYGPEFKEIEGRSNLFVRRSRERASTAHKKIMKLMKPITGDPWDTKPSPKPISPFGNDPWEAAKGMRAQLRDDLLNMDHTGTSGQIVWDMCKFGTGISYGPVGVRDTVPAWARILNLPVEMPARPDIQHVPFFELYCNPAAAKKSRIPAATWRHVLTRKGLKELALREDFDAEQIDFLIKALPNGNYIQEPWEAEIQDQLPKEPHWIVLERWGLVPPEKQKEWGGIDTTGFVNSWTCGPFTLSCVVDPFYERELPFDWIPYEHRDGSVYGSGPIEHIEDVQEMQGSLVRALHDNLADSSMPQTEADMTQLDPGQSLQWKPGQFWQKRPNELTAGRDAVKFFLPPNNSAQIIQAWQLFESMVPVATSLPTNEDPRDMGSAVRTVGMQAAAFANSDTFISQDVIGNIDEFGWTPWLKRLVSWNIAYNPDQTIKGDIQPVALGVYGAVRRELIAQNSQLLQQMLADKEQNIYLNDPAILAELIGAMGLESENTILGPAAVVAKLQAKAQHEAMMKGMATMAEQSISHGIRASSSRADALLTILRSIKNDENPAWGPTFQQAMEAQGAMTPAIYAGLVAWAAKQEAQLLAMGDASVGQGWKTVMQGFKPQKDLDLDPDYRGKGMGTLAGALPAPGAPTGVTVEGQMNPAPAQELAPDASIPGGSGE